MKKLIALCVLCAFVGDIAAQSPKIYRPKCMVIDSENNMFIGEEFNLYKVTPTGEVSLYYDNSKNKTDRLEFRQMAIDKEDNIYFIGRMENKILKLTPNKIISNYVGNKNNDRDKPVDGKGAAAGFTFINCISISGDGTLYISSAYPKLAEEDTVLKDKKWNCVVRTIDKQLNVKTAKSSKTNKPKWFHEVTDVLANDDGSFYFGDKYALRKNEETSRTVLAGLPKKAYESLAKKPPYYIKFIMGDTSKAEFESANLLCRGKNGEILFLDNPVLRILKVQNGKVSNFAGNNDMSCHLQVICGAAKQGYKDGAANVALFSGIVAMAFDSNWNLIVLDVNTKANGVTKIRKITPTGLVTTIYNNGEKESFN